ncbi:MAG: aldose 1-epimerase family protein [Anaerolineae bacterium]|nr:aldose 1-epimerase family protein [Anaerolineae bacterium]
MKLFGKSYAPDELKRLTGKLDQLAGVRLGELVEGNERGLRVADVFNAAGLNFTVLLDRGMDIGAASFQGVPLALNAPSTTAHPSFYEPDGLGWLRTFGGGLMVGCGLSWYGPPLDDNGQHLGLHGRLSHIPARRVSTGAAWQNDDYMVWVEGQVSEALWFNYHLVLTRRISTSLTASSLRIEDEVTNAGYTPAEHMMLYHCNFGFPFVSPDSMVEIDAAETAPRDAAAEKGVERWRQFDPPTPGFAEQVFYHTPQADDQGYAQARLVNPALGMAAYVRYRQAELPCLTQWKMMGAGTYVCGLEPGSAQVNGRLAARKDGQLRVLEPGESVSYAVEIGVTSSD